MAENKTRPTKASVAAYLAAIKDETRREDCKALAKLMTKATGEKPVMWGPGIVGFGTYHYKYDSGREGDSCLAGFSSRKNAITVYMMGVREQSELLQKLGKHKTTGGCLYINRLDDIDVKVLEKLVVKSVASLKRRLK
ncbi:MAG TPA: DUF1801 domain-containing protein [Candidatus Krumholzibacteria bacterium]|nr:DUF1801 domain-containing protein [Candidatus Krumholzibacteria bacterium]